MRRLVCTCVVTAVAFAGLLCARAEAAVIVVTLPDFVGPDHASGFPIDLGVVDTFAYALPADAVIVAATFSGLHGTTGGPFTTASYDVEIEGEPIAVCPPFAAGCWEFGGPVLRPFSFALGASSFPGLLDGVVDLRVIQTTEFTVRLAAPTLTLDYTVPEPATVALVGLAIAGVSWRRRRSMSRPAQTSRR